MSSNQADRVTVFPSGVDIDSYLDHLADFDMTIDQKREYLRNLSSILQTFIQQDFDSPDENS